MNTIMISSKTRAALLGASLLLACSPAATTRGPGGEPVVPQPPPRVGGTLLAEGSTWVDQTLARLTLRQKVGQLVMPRISGAYMPTNGPEYERLRDWVVKYGVGGLIITQGPPLEMAAKLNTLQGMAEIPLLVTADMEHGPGQILQTGIIMPYGIDNGGGTRFPPIMALGAARDEQLAFELGRITALEARAVGVHVTFAPVVDVNNNPNNPIINTRSYGADPDLVSRMAAAHIRGLQQNGMIATAKHFPGHGDTGTDSHVNLPVITVGKSRADQVELPPYQTAIKANVAAIMTAHIAFPALTGDSIPATLNRKILTGLLRDELDYQGIIFTDAMDMGALVTTYGRFTSPVMALQAGADVLLQPFPQDVPAIIDTVVAAVQAGTIPEARINEALKRLLNVKAQLGLQRSRTVDLQRVQDVLGKPEHQQRAQEAADRSITVVRDNQKLLPVSGRVLSIVYADDYDPLTGRTFQNTLRGALPDLRTLTIDANADVEDIRRLAVLADSAEVVLFSPYIRVQAAKADLAIPTGVAEAINAVAVRKPVVVTAFGNPYVLTQFPNISTYVLAWGQWDVSQRAAARALLGQIPIQGKLPIDIPPYHRLGEGIAVGAK
jgi:beta-N-acetylhexosaminidase